MAAFKEYGNYDGVGLAGLIAKGEVSEAEVTEAAIEAIERQNSALGAVVTPHYDAARAAVSTGLPDGSLRGVPFLLKDIGASCAGLPLTVGSRFFGHLVPDRDWVYTERLKQAGVVILGTTKTCELGISVTCEPILQGPTRNPWDLSKSPGGSSGGSGAAVASGMVPVAYGGDAFGSIRAPASCCGVVGLKPSRGRISHGPDVGELMSGIVVIGFLSRTVRDQAAFLDVVSGPYDGDPYEGLPRTSCLQALTKPPKKLRIAVGMDLGVGTAVDPACRAAVQDAAQACRELGHNVEEAAVGLDLEEVQRVFRCLINVDTALALKAHPVTGQPATEAEVERVTWATAGRGKAVSAIELVEARQSMEAIGRKMAAFHRDYDVMLSPTLAMPPVDLGWLDMMMTNVDAYWDRVAAFAPFCVPFNLSGQPAVTLPLGTDPQGLPIGVQFSAARGADDVILSLAAQLEEARPWASRRPPERARLDTESPNV